jgi:hypothetical protein
VGGYKANQGRASNLQSHLIFLERIGQSETAEILVAKFDEHWPTFHSYLSHFQSIRCWQGVI